MGGLRFPRGLPPTARPRRRRGKGAVQFEGGKGEVLKAEGWVAASGRGDRSRRGRVMRGAGRQEAGRDGGQVRWVWSRDEREMSGDDCPRERLGNVPHVSLAV